MTYTPGHPGDPGDSPPHGYLQSGGIDVPPTLPDLIRLGVVDGICHDYRIFGIRLLNDARGQLLRTIEVDSRGHKEIVLEIFRQWLEGKGLPVTWRTLVETLKRINEFHLAHKIEAICLK